MCRSIVRIALALTSPWRSTALNAPRRDTATFHAYPARSGVASMPGKALINSLMALGFTPNTGPLGPAPCGQLPSPPGPPAQARGPAGPVLRPAGWSAGGPAVGATALHWLTRRPVSPLPRGAGPGSRGSATPSAGPRPAVRPGQHVFVPPVFAQAGAGRARGAPRAGGDLRRPAPGAQPAGRVVRGPGLPQHAQPGAVERRTRPRAARPGGSPAGRPRPAGRPGTRCGPPPRPAGPRPAGLRGQRRVPVLSRRRTPQPAGRRRGGLAGRSPAPGRPRRSARYGRHRPAKPSGRRGLPRADGPRRHCRVPGRRPAAGQEAGMAHGCPRVVRGARQHRGRQRGHR